MEKGLISILVPMYNSEKYISKCIDSLLQQTYKNFELIVVDDGSTDNSYKIMEEYALKDARIKLLRKENEKSVSLTRNFLLKQISGEYFIFVDSDDVVSKRYLELLLEVMEKTNSDVSCCNFSFNKIGLSKTKRLKGIREYDQDEALRRIILTKPGQFVVWNKLIKTRYLNDLSFYKDVSYGEDFIFNYELLQQKLKISMIKNKLYAYKVRTNSLSRKVSAYKKQVFLDKMIELNKSSCGVSKEVLSSWIHITSGYYLFLIKFKKMEGTYKDKIKISLNDTYDIYRNTRGIFWPYRFFLSLVRVFRK